MGLLLNITYETIISIIDYKSKSMRLYNNPEKEERVEDDVWDDISCVQVINQW